MARAGEASSCEAEQLPYGKEREELLRKARQLETASYVNEWLSSPGLAPSNGARSGTWLSSGFRALNLFEFFTKGWKHSTIAHRKCPSLSCRMMGAGWPL